MEYFKILNLDREPFSNSPEPDFFYQSPQHVRCLQQIELAIRLRRGLSVVLGHVGTGKTTLCRHLIAQFAASAASENAVETHLLMDPSFSSPRELLSAVAMGFGIMADAPAWTDWQLKEKIKNYLFQRGVDEGRIVVLIIDEGQKLPDFCLEILREFLNYETNEYKLLQIIIFGQPEFQQSLNHLANVADRVNMLYVLEPLNFQETRKMIRYRLAQAALPESPPKLFTIPGFLAIYRATGGYPRKIITLCHQVVLAMIIQNRSKAGWFLVRSCALRLASADQRRPWRSLHWITGVLVFLTAMLLIFSLQPLTLNSTKEPASARREVPQATPEVKKSAPLAAAAAPDITGHAKPELIGKLRLKDGRTIWWLLTDFYGTYNQSILRSVSRANPHIKNMNQVKAGEVIRFRNLRILTEGLEANRTPERGETPQYNYIPNTVTERERRDGWRLLWDGKTTSGWRGARLDRFPAGGWEIRDGVLTVLESGGGESTAGGDIVTVDQYGNFELIVEYNITKGANSGIKYFVDTNLNKGQGSAIGCEFQILDDAEHPDAKAGVKGNRRNAGLYDLIAPQNVRFNGVGEWNRARIVVQGRHVEHWLNGFKTVEYERGTQMWRALVDHSKYVVWPSFGEAPKGYILLQDHGNRVSFRSIKIRELK